MKFRTIETLFVILALVTLTVPARVAAAEDTNAPASNTKTEEPKPETKEERDARMKWWREARFGMFIHWGLYAVPAGTWNGKQIGGIGEWIMNNGKIPMKDYANFATQFDPTKFNADTWVKTAKDAGMKYMVITSKHHDGFAMFHSKTSPYNIYDATPFKRDPLAELSAACKKQGMKLGFYYSQCQDWGHPGGAIYGTQWDPGQAGDYDEYLKTIALPQVKEILSNYGPVAALWWDTPKDMSKERAEPFVQAVKKLQPNIIMNNRLGGGFAGDTETPEQFIPATGFKGRDWETCMTMNDTWGYKSYDNDWKSTATLLHNLCDIASKGGNYLLNVGPTAEGVFPDPILQRLKEIGTWMKANGESIYGTSASPFKKLSWGRSTQKPGKLYLHVFNWPADGKLLVPMSNKVTRAYLLTDPGTELTSTATDTGAVIQVPATAPDPIVSVVVAEIDGTPQPLDAGLQQDDNGTIRLNASDADIVGGTAKLEGGGESNIGYWLDVNDYVQWKVKVTKAGSFQVDLNYACDKGSGGSEYKITAGDESVSGKIDETSSWGDYRTVHVGTLKVDNEGMVTFAVKPSSKPGQGVMNLRSVVLKPVQ